MDSIEDAYPLSRTQQGILFHSLQGHCEDSYLSVISMAVTGQLDVQAFKQSWQRVLKHHAALRSSVVIDGLEQPLWVVHESIELAWDVIDLSAMDAVQRHARVNELIAGKKKTHFKFSADPLMNFTLIKHSESNHELLWTIHHLLSDGWSTAIVLEDLSITYNALRQNKTVSLQPALRYQDYLQYLSEIDQASCEHYWSKYLDQREPTPLKLVETSAIIDSPIESKIQLDEQFTQSIKRAAQAHESTVSVLLLAAWALVLKDYTQVASPNYGVTLAGRPTHLPTIERGVGLYISTVPMCIDFPESMSVKNWLSGFMRTLNAHAEHASLPLVDIQKTQQNRLQEPLFNSVVAIEGHEGELCFDSTSTGGIRIDSLDYHIRSHFDLSLLITPGSRTEVTLITQLTTVDAATHAAILKRYKDAVKQLVGSAGQSVGSLVADAPLYESIDTSKNKTPVLQYDRMDQWIMACASRHPSAIALQQGDQIVSYFELAERSEKICNALNRLGLNKAQPIGLCFTDTLEAIISMLGVLRAGISYVVMDAEQPHARNQFICEDANCSLVIVEIEGFEWPCEAFERNALEALDVITAHREDALSDDAYIIYTSGSTGAPKGVRITHSNLIYSTAARFEYYKKPVERYLLVSPLHFDSSVAGIYWTLCSGGHLVIPERLDRKDVSHWSDLIKRHAVTHTLCLPSVYRLWLKQCATDELQTLNTVIVAGEPCDADLCVSHSNKLPTTKLYNEYGPTECCVWSAVYECHGEIRNPVPIGAPIPGTQMDIVGLDGRRCPDGVEGELRIISDGVANKYINQDALNAKKFVGNPPCYYTGDLAYVNRAGEIVCTGRADRQIKVRGQRVEPGEIEQVARQVAGIDSVHAFLAKRFDEDSEKLFLAYSPETISETNLKTALQQNMHESMIPAGLLPLSDMPRLANGKVSETALVEQVLKLGQQPTTPHEIGAKKSSISYSDTERLLLDAVNTLLSEEVSDITKDVASSGLDSIDAMKLNARIREEFQVNLKLRTLLDSASWEALASHIDSLVSEELNLSAQAVAELNSNHSGVPNAHPTPDSEESKRAPASTEQTALWYASQATNLAELYAVQSSVKIRGSLSLECVHDAMNALVQRHEILRTRLRLNDLAELEQIVLPAEHVPVIIIDAKADGMNWQEAQQVQLAIPFDLAHDQLFRVFIYRFNDTHHGLMMHSHHVALDGWSFDLLFQQFVEKYEWLNHNHLGNSSKGNEKGITVYNKSQANQYRHYALQQPAEIERARQRELSFWCENLKLPRERLNLPFDADTSSRKQFHGDSNVQSIPLAVTSQWAKLAQEKKTTPFVVALSAIKYALRTTFQAYDVRIGTPVSNRMDAEWQNTCGFFSNTAVIRTQHSPKESFEFNISATAAALSDAIDHQHLPFADIVQALGLSGSSGSESLFDVYFVYQHRLSPLPQIKDLSFVRAENLKLNAAKFPLSIEIRPSENVKAGYDIHLNYNTAWMKTSTAVKLTNNLISAFNPVDTSDMAHVVNVYSPPTAITQKTVIDVFDSTVARSPNNVALVHGAQTINFSDLNKWVTHLADYLEDIGVVRGEIIALSMSRSMHQIAAALAIWRCGALCCPVDPTYPPHRKTTMVAVSGARFVLDDQIDSVLWGDDDVNDVNSHSFTRIGIDPLRQIGQNNPSGKPQVSRAITEDEKSACHHRTDNRCALLMFTSGSTASPKGVLLGHEAVLNRFSWMWMHYPFRPEDVNVIKTSCSFIDSIWESFGALLSGTPSVIVDDAEVQDVQKFVALLKVHRVSRLLVVPSLLKSMLDWLEATQQNLPQLTLCSCSGEELTTKTANKFLEIQANSRLLNLYGCTEVMADATCLEVVRSSSDDRVSIGLPITGMHVFVLDSQMASVKTGDAGEIAIGGWGLAQGYLEDTQIESEKFKTLPDLGRVFLTGDHGHMDEFGRLYYHGRKDSQVKVRGVRINCAAIENAINKQPSVVASLVFAVGELNERKLVAVVQNSEHSGADSDIRQIKPASHTQNLATGRALSQALSRYLPKHQLPDHFQFVNALPRLPNGKLDRVTAMRLYGNSKVDSKIDSTGVADSTSSNEALCTNVPDEFINETAEYQENIDGQLLLLWQDVLSNRKLTVSDDFFDSGGYSLLAVKTVLRINQELLAEHNIEIKLGDLLENSNVSALSNCIRSLVHTSKLGLNRSDPKTMTQLKPGSGFRHVFMFPPFGHTSMYVKKFADAFPDDVAVHSFDYESGLHHQFTEETCEEYVEDILAVQPRGPWVLVGVCYGNVLAFETARQLYEKTGIRSSINIIDSSPPKEGPSWKHRKALKRPKHVRLWQEWRRDFGVNLIKERIRIMRGKHNPSIQLFIDIQMSQSAQYEQYVGIQGVSDICMFHSEKNSLMIGDIERWRELTSGKFTVHRFVGTTHKEFINPDSKYWGEIAETVLEHSEALSTERTLLTQDIEIDNGDHKLRNVLSTEPMVRDHNA